MKDMTCQRSIVIPSCIVYATERDIGRHSRNRWMDEYLHVYDNTFGIPVGISSSP